MIWKVEPAVRTDSERLFELLHEIWHDMSLYTYQLLPYTDYRCFMLEQLRSENTKYSYQHCWVVRDAHDVIQGVLLGYEGDLESELDQQLFQDFKNTFPDLAGNVELGAMESRIGEWYLDSLVVAPESRGKGIAQAFFRYIQQMEMSTQIIGLNCDVANPHAKRLYERIGFKVVDQVSFSGHLYDHMQLVLGGQYGTKTV